MRRVLSRALLSVAQKLQVFARAPLAGEIPRPVTVAAGERLRLLAAHGKPRALPLGAELGLLHGHYRATLVHLPAGA